MKRTLVNKALKTFFLSLSFILLAQIDITMDGNSWAVSYSAAVAAEEPEKRSRVRRSQTLRPVIYKKLEMARTQADSEDYDGAIATLTALEKRRRNSYETAMTHNMFAYIYVSREQFGNASQEYEKVVAIKNIPDSLRQSTLYSLAKLHLMNDEFAKASVAINNWFQLVEKPSADAYILRAQVNFQLSQYELAKTDISVAINSKRDSGVPPQNWLLLERAILYQLKDYQSLSRCLEDLVSMYPKADYWVQLAAVYSELGQADRELTTLETAYDQGLLTKSSELINYSQALLINEVPYKAAEVLTFGLKNQVIEESGRYYSLLGDAWMMAREYELAIVAMVKAAKLSQKSDDYYKLAQIYTERQEWDKVIESSEKAFSIGEMSDPGQLYILNGLAHFYSQSLDDAALAFQQAKEYQSATSTAQQWLKFIKSEKARLNYIANSN